MSQCWSVHTKGFKLFSSHETHSGLLSERLQVLLLFSCREEWQDPQKSGLTIKVTREVACTPRTNKELLLALRVVLLVLYTCSPSIQTHPPSSNIIRWWTGSLRVGAKKCVRTMASRMHESNLRGNVLSYRDNAVQGHTKHFLKCWRVPTSKWCPRSGLGLAIHGRTKAKIYLVQAHVFAFYCDRFYWNSGIVA